MSDVGERVDEWPADAVEVGRVVGAWGIKGALKIMPHAADPQGLYCTKRWYLAAPEAPRAGVAKGKVAASWPRRVHVMQARAQGEVLVATIDGLTDRSAAEALNGARVHVPRSSFPSPAADEYYWVDLIGLQVFNRQSVDLGHVISLQETGPHCVLRLDSLDADGQQRMVPFVAAYIDSVDLAARRMVVDWPADF